MLTYVIQLQFSYMSRINNKLQFDEGMDTTRVVEAPWWHKSTNSATYNQPFFNASIAFLSKSRVILPSELRSRRNRTQPAIDL
jgi:hypothetical protein